MLIVIKVQELNSGTEASFLFFISNIFCSVKRKSIAFRMVLSQFRDNSSWVILTQQ